MPVRHNIHHLLQTFKQALGSESAAAELRWMREALRQWDTSAGARTDTHPSLEDMIARRTQGEPLQYILGK